MKRERWIRRHGQLQRFLGVTAMSVRWIEMSVVVGLMMLCATAVQADGGRPSRATLEAMGLGSLHVISDDAATAVRGHGYQGGGAYVRVTGSSFATIEGPDGGSHSENSYFAEGKHKAKGNNSSYAGVTNTWGGGGNGGPRPTSSAKPGGGYGGGGGGGGYGNVKTHTRVYFSGGSSSAWAF
jgi:hypothetical protein